MGGSSSKPVAPEFKLDYSNATVTATDAAAQIQRASEEAAKAVQDAANSTWANASKYIYFLLGVVILGGIGFGVYLLLVKFGIINNSNSTINTILHLPTATQDGKDITSSLGQYITNGNSLLVPANITKSLTQTVSPNTSPIIITYLFSDDGVIHTYTHSDDGLPIAINPSVRPGVSGNQPPLPKSTAPVNAPNPSFYDTISSYFNTSSGNQLPTAKDTRSQSTAVPATSSKDGNYSYQFWMYIKDWNTNFGKEKHILSRNDTTNSQIMNPKVTLHPTDNTMIVSVSVFPSSQDGSKDEPAPAGHSGTSDDVFTCEVPDIPLQSWVSVGITLFTRNLDIYLNGKLVKSCVLSGVPKPAEGIIDLNKDGGFSGYMCGFYHTSTMLQPSDAQSFYSKGTPCSVKGASTNYDVTFGMFNSAGKEVDKYVF